MAISFAMVVSLVVVLGLAGWAVAGIIVGPSLIPGAPKAAAAPPLKINRAKNVTYATATNVPVLVYHEMNNGCAATAVTCNSHDPETVSTTQFNSEMYYLSSNGYHTVTLQQYTAWLGNARTRLPSKPILITADNGIFSFLDGAQNILANYGFTATAFLVTGFVNAAGGSCSAVTVQPGCPGSSRFWDATWAQLQGLSQGVWSFGLEAGASGHYVQNYNPHCTVFDTCLLPGETFAGYQARMGAEFGNAESELRAVLAGRVDLTGWVVPYSDLGYHQCGQSDCTSQAATIPKGWLVNYATAHFKAVFVEDAIRNGIDNERFRFDVNGQDTQAYFQQTLQHFISAGDFDRR